MEYEGKAPMQDFTAPLDLLEVAICTKDCDGHYTYANQHACKLLQRPRHEVLGKTDDELFPAEIAHQFRQHDLQVMSTGKTWAVEKSIPLPASSHPPYMWNLKQPLFNPAGEVIGVSLVAFDITDYVRREADAKTLKNHYKTILKAIPDLVFELDLDGRYYNIHAPEDGLLAAPAEYLQGKTIQEVLPKEVADLCMEALHEAHEKGYSVGQQYSLELAHGICWFELSIAPLPVSANEAPHFIVLARDITERKEETLVQLQKSESLLRAIVDNTPVEYWARDLNGICIMENTQGIKRLGSLLGTHPRDLGLPAAELQDWEKNNARAYAGETVENEFETNIDGERHVYRALIAPMKMADRIVGIIGFNQDITEYKKAEEQIRNLAFFDPLTQLPNRRLMFDRLDHARSSCTRRHRAGALLLIDLDNFKQLNDTQGHDAGDMLLIEAANRLNNTLRKADTAARLGGDEFVVILDDLDPDEDGITQAEHVAIHIQQRLSQPYRLKSKTGNHELVYHCSCSIGITLFQDATTSSEELMRRADTAMYQAKAASRNCVRFFDPAMQALVAARAALEEDMRAAFEQHQFMLYYQPQIDSNNNIVGAEALLRWLHPVRGMVSPTEFIPVAEASGLITPLGRWVLEATCQQLALWAKNPLTADLSISINVSAREFHQLDFAQITEQLLKRTGAPGNRLKLELTESLLLDNSDDVVQRMLHLQGLGISFSLDDFGTGYSSLVYLKRLPLAQLKIDQSFVRDILTDPNDAVIARTILALGGSLGLEVIAEGVETEAQHQLLANNGCLRYQGYLFGRPMPLEQFEHCLARSHPFFEAGETEPQNLNPRWYPAPSSEQSRS